MKSYLDFEVRVAVGAGLDYPVTVIRSPAGEARGTMRFPYDASALERQLLGLENAILKSASLRRDIRTTAPETSNVTEFGTRLFEALFNDDVQTTLRRSQDRARAEKKGLRVRMRIEAPELSSLPWEFMYDPHEGDFVCLSSETPIVRYLEFDQPLEELSVEPPIAVLAVCASPTDRPGLDVEKERARIETATHEMQEDGVLTLSWLEQPTYRSLQRMLRRGTFHILHFVGHGGFDAAADEGLLALTNDDGGSALISATDLARLLADHPTLRLVVLNACLGARGSATNVFSSTAAALVRRGVPAVVAMQYEISDLAAIEFSRSLYEAIADGLPIDAAVSEARKMVVVSARNSVEWGTPVLHMRSPDGALFKVDTSRTGTRNRVRASITPLPDVREAPAPAVGPAPVASPSPPAAPPIAALSTSPASSARTPSEPPRKESSAGASESPPPAALFASAATPEESRQSTARRPQEPTPWMRRPVALLAIALVVGVVGYKMLSGSGDSPSNSRTADSLNVATTDTAPVAGLDSSVRRSDAASAQDGRSPGVTGQVAVSQTTSNSPAPGEPVEQQIAKAYLRAISGGRGSLQVPNVVDYGARGCNPSTVWDDACQGLVYNGKEGKKLFMETIEPVSAGADWRQSNIAGLLPEEDMRRIMTTPAGAKTKDIFTYMSDPNNDWFVEHKGPGRAKSVLRSYMDAVIVEERIAMAYLQAVSGGGGESRVPNVVDFAARGCTPNAVWDDPCQGPVYNGKDGKTLFMEAIAPVAAGADWRSSNIQRLLPPADMRRIMTNPAESKVKDIFSNMSDPNNDWFIEHKGPGRAKSILRGYMDAMAR